MGQYGTETEDPRLWWDGPLTHTLDLEEENNDLREVQILSSGFLCIPAHRGSCTFCVTLPKGLQILSARGRISDYNDCPSFSPLSV